MMKQRKSSSNQAFRLGDWYVEPDRNSISRKGQSAHLQPKMMAVLAVLVEREGETVEKNELLDLVWPRQYINEEVLKRVILKLRQALGDDSRKPVYIETIHRKGYRLMARVQFTDTIPQGVTGNWPGGSPFRSLSHFETSDSHIFFGRSSAVAEARIAMTEQRARKRGFLLISGASGAGKSSFVRAGLIPALLRDRNLADSSLSIIRPFNLLNISQDSNLGRIAAKLDKVAIDKAENLPATPLLLIDQFEEALLLDDCAAIMARVHHFARSGLLDVIITMREDFIPLLNDWPTIARLKQGAGTFTLGKPSQSELAEILQGPAGIAGFQYEISEQHGSLKREIITSANNIRQSLPLLQFLLHRMYEEREHELLSWESYHRLGGLVGAISNHADEVMNNLDQPLTDALPGLLDLLTRFDLEHQRITRQPAPINKIATDPQRKQLALALVDARLLTSETHSNGQACLSLIHETLLEHWGMARTWAEQNLARLAALRRTQLAYNNWEQGGNPADLLLRAGSSLADGIAVTQLKGLDANLQDYISQSQKRVFKRSRIRRVAVVMLATLTVISFTASFIANQQRESAEQSLDSAKRATNFVIGLFNTTSPNSSAETLTAREMLDEGVRRIPVEFSRNDINRAQLMHATGRLYMQMGEYERAEELLVQALQETREGVREKYTFAWSLAELRDVKNRDIADQREDELLKLAIKNLVASGAGDEEVANAYWRAARLVMPEWRYSPYFWERAYDLYAMESFSDNPEAPEMLMQYAVVLAYSRRTPVMIRDTNRAIELLNRALEIYKSQKRTQVPAYFRALETAAKLEYSIRSTKRGIALQREAAEGSLQNLGRLHIATPFRWQILGDMLLRAGLYTEASVALQQAAEIYYESYTEETPRWFVTSLSLADAWFYSGRHQEARQLLEVLNTRQERAWGRIDHPETWRLWLIRGHLARSHQNYDEAAMAYQRAKGLVDRIAAEGNLVRKKIALELDYLSVTDSTRISDFSMSYFDQEGNWIKYQMPPMRVNSLWPYTSMLIKLLHLDCNSVYAKRAATSLTGVATTIWKDDVWQQYAVRIELARCNFLKLDTSEFKKNAEAIARLTHPSTFMAQEAAQKFRQRELAYSP